MSEMTAPPPTVRRSPPGGAAASTPGARRDAAASSGSGPRCRSSLAARRSSAWTSTCRSLRPLLALVLLVAWPTLVLVPPGRLPQRQPGGAAAATPSAPACSALIVVGLPAQPVAARRSGSTTRSRRCRWRLTWLVLDVALLAWRPSIAAASPAFSLAHARPPRARRPLRAGAGPGRRCGAAGRGRRRTPQQRRRWRRRRSSPRRWPPAALLALMLRREGSLGRDVAVARPGRRPACCSRPRCAAGRSPVTTSRPSSSPSGSPTTPSTGRWARCENAYNACLSVNILPTVLAQTTGLSGEVVFKVLLQLVFAIVPVLTFLYSRRFLSRRLALVAATFTLAFPTFFTDMPYLVRQEIAFFFLALLLLAATEPPGAVAAAAGGPLRPRRRAVPLLDDLRDAAWRLVFGAGRDGGPAGRAAPVPGRGGHRAQRRAAPFRLVLLNPLVIVAFLVVASFAVGRPGHAHRRTRLRGRQADHQRDHGQGRRRPRLLGHLLPAVLAGRHHPARPAGQLRRRDDGLPQREHPAAGPAHQEAGPAGAASGDRAGEQGAAHRRGQGPATRRASTRRRSTRPPRSRCAALMQVFLLLGLVWLVWRRRGAGDPPRPSARGRLPVPGARSARSA